LRNKVKVIIPASGIGSRFGSKLPKQFSKINRTEIIAITLSKFHAVNSVDEIIVSVHKDYLSRTMKIISKYGFGKVKKIVEGGVQRQHSVFNALQNLHCISNDIIIVHDAVRPFISVKKIKELISAAKKHRCVILGLPVSDTLKLVNGNELIQKTIDRKNIRFAQTPQAFRYDILMKAFSYAVNNRFLGTDEASIVEYCGFKVKVIPGEIKNIKITVKDDLYN